MRHVALFLRYCGENFHGWQIQNNALSVQGTLNDALKSLFADASVPVGCSRTDAGVHANVYCAVFDFASDIPCERLVPALNSKLPKDISVLEARDMPAGFHPIYDCREKEYIYKIHNAKIRDPFLYKRAYFYPYLLDEKLLDSEAKSYIGRHDFSAFMATGGGSKTTVRTVNDAEVCREGDLVIFKISADGFLYNMVRIMTGTLLYIARGKIGPRTIPEIIGSCCRNSAGVTVPPCGLYLNRVCYEDFELKGE